MTIPLNHRNFKRGIDLFNRAHFFDAHEVLEDVWRSLPRNRPKRLHLRLHLQGLIQLAVAFHHASGGNHVGARSVLARAMRNLDGAERSFPELNFDLLRAELALWQQYLDSDGAPEGLREQDRVRKVPALPKITLRRKTKTAH